MMDKFSTAISINGEPADLWAALTKPELMATWLGEPETKIEVDTTWDINTPIFIRGFHHVPFENKGMVLQYDNERKLRYSHLSSVSRLPDKPENYSILEFTLTPIDNQTLLALSIENFPTESIQKHLEFYWRTTVLLIKKSVEELADESNQSLAGS
ncbi:SRPBCC domain-containing protein [Spirosoma aureum]|uniref:SRPBCC domain-containing protein n=1 Tax=Spirosoma aureum TaxID=2692134 RepID=A0A6G9AQK3_9BACT|nr:SRPBCC domain-containing protein [Spirosoma aureum]QIP14555.1 SRPBCC domain-containing protein [Spirosoma aureum]